MVGVSFGAALFTALSQFTSMNSNNSVQVTNLRFLMRFYNVHRLLTCYPFISIKQQHELSLSSKLIVLGKENFQKADGRILSFIFVL